MSTNSHPRSSRDGKATGTMDRRKVLKAGGILLGAPACACALPALGTESSGSQGTGHSSDLPRWGMVIDVTKCRDGCDACLAACRTENNLAPPENPATDIHFIRKVNIRRKHSESAVETPVPLLCNHCDNPPCVQVCPVTASFQRPDGIVMCDPHRCIGCRYCLIACPYNARYFVYAENHAEPTNPSLAKRSHGVSTACNFCAHLVDQGKTPACVEACSQEGGNALVFGDLNDPDSEISRLVAANQARGLREDLGTRPKVYYIGL